MTSAAFPTVIAAVVATATATLPGVTVVRGRYISNAPVDVVMVGVADPDDSGGWDDAGAYQQTMQTFSGKREERGQVNCIAVATNGDSDPAAALAAAFTMIAALEASVATTPALGVSSLEYLVAEFESGSVQESLSADGASAALSFVITYQARI
jgi:hypothetical protein